MYIAPRPSAPSSLYTPIKPQHTVKKATKQVFTFINGLLTPIQEVPTYDFH